MITPSKFYQKINNYQKGDKGFIKFASVSNKDSNVIIGFWFQIIRNDWKIVLSVRYKSLSGDQPVQTIVIAGEEKLRKFLENSRQWAQNELSSLLTNEPENEKDEMLVV